MRTAVLILLGVALLAPSWTNLSGASELERWLLGPGGNPADIERDVLWLDSPDFYDNAGTSEVIGAFDFWTETANDFQLEVDATIRKVTWWGTYWNGYEEPTGSGFNLRFYHNAGCLPEETPFVEYLLPGDDCCEAFAEGGDQFSQFVYEYCLDLPLAAGHYWFSAQMADHDFPPQWSRQGIGQLVHLCDTAFRSPYFSYPEWVPAAEGAYLFDVSQMFEDVCEATAIENASWGAVKGLYR